MNICRTIKTNKVKYKLPFVFYVYSRYCNVNVLFKIAAVCKLRDKSSRWNIPMIMPSQP